VILLTLREGKALQAHLAGEQPEGDDLERTKRVLDYQIQWLTRRDNSGRFSKMMKVAG
jgi:hypothetical protein